MRIKGGATTHPIGARLTESQEKSIEYLVKCGVYVSLSEFVRDAVREKLSAIKMIDLRNMPKHKAKSEIIDYLKDHQEAYASEIAINLRLDIDLVLSVLDELKKEGRVE